jgi:DNA-binding NarL/FixJ family response regulator
VSVAQPPPKVDEDTERESNPVPMPEGARAHALGPDLILIEYPLPIADIPAEFTEAEQEVALLVFQGATDQEIASIRGVSAKTVSKQLEAIYRKLGVASRAELVLYLRRTPCVDD